MEFLKNTLLTMVVCLFLFTAGCGPSALAAEKPKEADHQKAAKTISNELTPTIKTGWCCVRGSVAVATEKECNAQAGLYGTDEAQVRKRCAAAAGGSRRHEIRKPSTQVVNNSGIAIYQVKVGNTIFSEHLSYCFDGCSTGFKTVGNGINQVSVKMGPAAAWQVVGSLTGFENNKHYAVNMVRGSGGLCAELYHRADTTPYFNDDRTKRMVGSPVCGRFFTPIPVERP